MYTYFKYIYINTCKVMSLYIILFTFYSLYIRRKGPWKMSPYTLTPKRETNKIINSYKSIQVFKDAVARLLSMVSRSSKF